MKINVEYVAQMKKVAGINSETVTLPDGAPVQALVTKLADDHDQPFRDVLLDANASLRKSTLVFIGDDQIEWEVLRELADGDRVTILAPLAGG
ncbi:MAG: MoaD/ThiS family protein [Lentisphaerae bacterium]|jgi:molybdopterin converting factor small subunit|nr:MoaD/ThiS family protein [Lentisphaerota bacterium]MBT4816273.1 MoaD/ThiS family protein [Lentisphaerota bacterium]MBT5608818.1 MoaD/ThiS family protein [Lentisphaerota bacterium]MBT7059978.1 MoaD/ThiS family protein [Lentisphaerota bacterium]MBT7840304.1 MoaD/ThiS family protein [Lentisphaerota bacterium]